MRSQRWFLLRIFSPNFPAFSYLAGMPLILNIDTAVQSASICVAEDQNVLASAESFTDKESAAWVHTAIQDLFQQNNLDLRKIDAVAVSAGPGSYTGLRVGMAAAKGLCYALSVPLISISTLQMMTVAAREKNTRAQLFCPLIDARRMEVFAAVYDEALAEVMPPANLILTENSFSEFLAQNTVLFFGNGGEKAKDLLTHANALFATVQANAQHMSGLSAQKFEQRQFSELAYTEPFYGKEFYSPHSKTNN